MKDPLIIHSVKTSAVECYLQHATITKNFTKIIKNENILKIGEIFESIKNLNECRYALVGQPHNDRENIEIEGQYAHISDLVNDLPGLEYLE